MSSYSARDASRRGSVVPPLAGIERPQIESLPDKCDVLICGTGLCESILAAALAWQGTNVLHIDANNVYGDSSACLSLSELGHWIEEVANAPDSSMNAQLYAPRPVGSQRYLVDLAPHIMFAKSDLLELLVKSRVFRYLEFKSLSQFHTYEQDSFERVAGNKEAIFTDQSLTTVTKRHLMKFIKWIVAWDISEDKWRELARTPVSVFLTEEFKLAPPQVTELVTDIGLCDTTDVLCTVALPRIRRYLLSLDIYGAFPVLYSMYGSGGELAQGFCRSAAVAGATYKLGTQLVAWDDTANIATLSDGSRVQVTEKCFISPTQSCPIRPSIAPPSNVTRMVAIVSNECREWFAEGESAAIVVFPPGTLGSEQEVAVHTIVYGSGSGLVPRGYSSWYLTSHNQDLRAARRDLSTALERLESSILRESAPEADLASSLKNSEFSGRPNGSSFVSSIRLGESLQNFVPRQKLQYLLKLCYTSPASHGVSRKEPEHINGSSALLATPFQLDEISYDGVVQQARKLYEAVVGSDDDFFDVDFEDEDEEMVGSEMHEHPPDEVMHMEI